MVATLGFVRTCSIWDSIPLLTPDLVARSSRVQANRVRCPRTLRATAALTSSGSGTDPLPLRINKLFDRFSIVEYTVLNEQFTVLVSPC